MPSFEKPGWFYLGRGHDLATGTTATEPLLYKSNDLTTHAVCVGMTGSGKTGLCLSLLEEAALDGVPAICIDPKGDLGNLLLAFPELAPDDFLPWIDPSEASRSGKSPEEHAAVVAEQWRTGLADWGQGPERIARYCDSVERVIYTPGSSSGIPLTVLKSFAAPPAELLGDDDALRERLQSAASGLLALLGIDADPVQSREHIYLSNLLDHAWRQGRDLSVAELIRDIQRPPFTTVGVMDIDTFYSASDRTALAMKLNNLLASPSFAGWMQGEPLSISRLLHSASGKPRLSILSIAHLNDAERMFFVTILLNELLAWTRTQPGTSSLRAILYMDEVFGYFPPTAEPPSKRPMLTLLKQARAYGLGCVLATQNPVDLDYKGLSNAGTWFLGRLQTERDKARVIEGLEGASAQGGASFNKKQMEATLAGLGKRVFLMHNVHDDAPQIFQTRWAMSYLRGPLTTGQIKRLMDGVRERFVPQVPSQAEHLAAEASPATPPAAPTPSTRPVLPAGVDERFVSLAEVLPSDSRLVYEPGLVGHARLHFVRASHDVDCWREVHALQGVRGDLPPNPWDEAYLLDAPLHYDDQEESGAEFGQLPSELAQASAYKSLGKALAEYLYRTQVLHRWYAKKLDLYSELGEEQGAFRQRLAVPAREARQRAADELEARYQKRIATVDGRVARARSYYDEQNTQFWGRVGSAVWRVMEVVLAMISGGKSTRRVSSSATAARQAATERSQAKRARLKLDAALAERATLEEQLEADRLALDQEYQAATIELESIEVTPRKGDIDISQISLVWLPGGVDQQGRRMPLY